MVAGVTSRRGRVISTNHGQLTSPEPLTYGPHVLRQPHVSLVKADVWAHGG